jgi:hypothetical protein
MVLDEALTTLGQHHPAVAPGEVISFDDIWIKTENLSKEKEKKMARKELSYAEKLLQLIVDMWELESQTDRNTIRYTGSIIGAAKAYLAERERDNNAKD